MRRPAQDAPGGRPADGDAAPDVSPTPRRRSATTLRFLLKDVERDQRRLERRRDELRMRLTAPEVVEDHALLAQLGRELAEVEAALAEVEDRWLELTVEADGSEAP